MSNNLVVYSLFDGSGLMVEPWAKAGAKCFCFNSSKGNHGEYVARVDHPNINYVDIWIEGLDQFLDFIGSEKIPPADIIFGFPDCTLFAVSGEQHERNADDIQVALANAKLVEALGDFYNCPWMAENPVGKLSTLWRKPNAYFNPHEYGGYMTEEDQPYHPRMPLFDGYTKKTCIWHGNGFEMPVKKPGPINIGYFWAWRWTGGKSARTKQLRSLTPRGFARAVFHDNHPLLDDQCCILGDCPNCIPF